MNPLPSMPKTRPSGATKLRGNAKSRLLVFAPSSNWNCPLPSRISGRSSPPVPPWMYVRPSGRVIELEYQRWRFMFPLRTIELAP
jgi:hypothetical protein